MPEALPETSLGEGGVETAVPAVADAVIPAIAVDSSLAWIFLAVLFALPVLFSCAAIILTKRGDTSRKPYLLWLCAAQSFALLVGVLLDRYLSVPVLRVIPMFFPFIMAGVYICIGFAIRSSVLWVAGVTLPALWYIAFFLCFSSTSFYLPDSPFFYGTVGLFLCLLPILGQFIPRLDGVTKINLIAGACYLGLATIIITASHLNFLIQHVAVITTVAIPLVLFFLGMGALTKRPNSSLGDWLLFAAAQGLAFCIVVNVLFYSGKLFSEFSRMFSSIVQDMASLALPLGICLAYLIISLIMRSAFWWVSAIVVPGLWMPFVLRVIYSRMLTSYWNILFLLLCGGLLIAILMFFKKRIFIQSIKHETIVIAGCYFVAALVLFILRLFSGVKLPVVG